MYTGNIKNEPICFNLKEVVMGVVIGNTFWRGENDFNEIFSASQQRLTDNYSIKTTVLGVEETSIATARACDKAGFSIEYVTDNDE